MTEKSGLLSEHIKVFDKKRKIVFRDSVDYDYQNYRSEIIL
jgi:hypothetical protein